MDSRITALYEDAQGVAWIGHDRGRLDNANQSPAAIVHIPNGAFMFPLPTVSAILRMDTWPS